MSQVVNEDIKKAKEEAKLKRELELKQRRELKLIKTVAKKSQVDSKVNAARYRINFLKQLSILSSLPISTFSDDPPHSSNYASTSQTSSNILTSIPSSSSSSSSNPPPSSSIHTGIDDSSAPIPLESSTRSSQLLNQPTVLGQYFGSNLESVRQKLVLKVTPDVKHTACTRCFAPIFPGQVRTRSKPYKHLVITCTHCHFVRQLSLQREHHQHTSSSARHRAQRIRKHQKNRQRRKHANKLEE